MSKISVDQFATTEKYDLLSEYVELLREDFVRFENGNKTAGKRLRKNLLVLRKWIQGIRVEILDELHK